MADAYRRFVEGMPQPAVPIHPVAKRSRSDFGNSLLNYLPFDLVSMKLIFRDLCFWGQELVLFFLVISFFLLSM